MNLRQKLFIYDWRMFVVIDEFFDKCDWHKLLKIKGLICKRYINENIVIQFITYQKSEIILQGAHFQKTLAPYSGHLIYAPWRQSIARSGRNLLPACSSESQRKVYKNRHETLAHSIVEINFRALEDEMSTDFSNFRVTEMICKN